MEALLGPSLRSKQGDVATSSFDAKYKLLYFSGHWCPPCRAFTPQLVMFYNEINASEKLVEIVFVSSDKTPEDFSEHYDSMPWLALPYEDQDTIEKLKNQFGIRGVPSLILVNSQGEAVNSECRGDITDMGSLCLAKWESLL